MTKPPLSPLALSGRAGEMFRWALGLVLMGVVAYFSAHEAMSDRITTMAGQAEAIKVLEQAHFDEIQRALVDIKAELVHIRDGGK